MCDPVADVRVVQREWPSWVGTSHSTAMAGIGHNWTFTWTMPNVWSLIRNPTFERIAAAQNDLFVGYVGFGISKRKKLVCADFIA